MSLNMNNNFFSNNLIILQWNVRSLSARLPSLMHLLHAHRCSIAILSETWLNPSRSINIPFFRIYRSDRPDGFGGVAVAIHHSLKSRPILIDNNIRNNLNNYKLDIIGVEIVSESSPPLEIWSCYIPSSSNVPAIVLQSLFSLISCNSILCGDFNSFHPAWGSDSSSPRGNIIYNTIDSLGLCILNDGSPTHIGRLNSTDSAIDLSFCSPNLYWNLSWHTLGEPHGSDHIPIIISATNRSLSNFTRSHHQPNNILIRHTPYNFNKANWTSFRLNIHDAISSAAEDSALIKSYSNFTEIILNAANLAIPVKKTNPKSHTSSPLWWNPSCSEAVKTRSLHFKIFRRSGSLSDLLKYRNVCAHTTRLLKNEKRNSWKKFCSNLNPSCSIQYLWATARRFKNCVIPTIRPDNDDWFDAFCAKIAPSYAPSELEASPPYYPLTSHPHVLSNKFTISELKFAIFSRKSIAPGLDNISPALLKQLPDIALASLLDIFNNLLVTQLFPTSWSFYRVIPIPKSNSNTSFRPIALSSSLCKVFEHMLKTRLDWWLESNSILPPNLFAFRKGMGTIECLSTFIGNIYHSFNNKEYFVATFIDIRGAFDSVNIHILVDYIISLNAPPEFGNILLYLFNKRNLVFSSSFGSSSSRSTFTGLPQGSCLSPLLFNIYMSLVAKNFSRSGHNCLIYADDMVIFSSNKSLPLAIERLNAALQDLITILSNVSLEIAPEKCKSVIFTRRKYFDPHNIYLDNYLIPFATTVTYLGITLDTKLRWIPHISSLSLFTSRWSNFLRTVSNTWWGSHPSSLLSIYRSIIRSKLDYGCFLFGSAAYSNWKKINMLQSSCLRTIMGYVRSTPGPAMEVETFCPPFNIRCRWLAGKFILKSLAHSNHIIFDTFYSLYITWRYTPKSMPVLSIAANSLSNFHQFVLNSYKLPLYEQPFDSLLYTPLVQIDNFSNFSHVELKSMSSSFVNKLFSNFLNLNYPNFTIIYTDGSVSPLSAGYAFYIPELHISFSNNLPPSSSSFTAECYAIFEALLFISDLAPNRYLIASDSMSCLQSLTSNPFNSKLSPLVFLIKSYIYTLEQSNHHIQFLWIPSHIGIHGNETADGLAKAASYTILPPLAQLPWTDFSPLLRRHIISLWSNHWNNLPAHFASRYKSIVPSIINKKTWFYNLDLPRSIIVRFNRLRVGHSLLPDHAYKLGLNDSPLCTLHITESICDISHLLFDCPSLYSKRTSLINYIKFLNIPPTLPSILNTQVETVIKKIIHFLLEAGFVI
uniref:RNA-directed DNA polymerase from mobile element jockey n=2 Tax=Melanaphis sacchari TaxID=742174 RepID=A0A2H8TL40_9HEMI